MVEMRSPLDGERRRSLALEFSEVAVQFCGLSGGEVKPSEPNSTACQCRLSGPSLHPKTPREQLVISQSLGLIQGCQTQIHHQLSGQNLKLALTANAEIF